MTRGKFLTSLNDSISLLKDFGLFKSKAVKDNGLYSEEFLKISKKHDIEATYNCAIKNYDYDILFADDSIMQFQMLNGELRYAFIQNPKIYYSKEEYLSFIFTEEELSSFVPDEFYDLINEDEYEQFLTEQNRNRNSNYIRYDFSPIGYKPLVHSYSHLHIGMNENVRIPTSKILTPLKFTKFCIKNTFYEAWKARLGAIADFDKEIAKMKNECVDLDKNIWQDIEKGELYLS